MVPWTALVPEAVVPPVDVPGRAVADAGLLMPFPDDFGWIVTVFLAEAGRGPLRAELAAADFGRSPFLVSTLSELSLEASEVALVLRSSPSTTYFRPGPNVTCNTSQN